jgi:hypothetical protein
MTFMLQEWGENESVEISVAESGINLGKNGGDMSQFLGE